MQIHFDLEAGVGYPDVGERDLVFNVSRLTEYLRCPARYAYRYVENRVPVGPPARSKAIGTVIHEACERVHNMDPLTEVEAWLRRRVDELGETMSERDRELSEKDLQWAVDALPVYHDLVVEGRFGWKTVIATEQNMWLRLLRGPEGSVYLVGRPDMVVVGRNEKLRHVQIKTLSNKVDPSHFATQTRFSMHEAVYGFMIENTFGMDLDVPYQGTQLIMLTKVPRPSEPVNRTKDGRMTEYYQKQLDKYENDKKAWSDRVVDHRMLAMGHAWRRQMLNEIADTVFGVTALEQGVRPWVRAGGSACHRYGRACGYMGACAGEEDLHGQAFTDREADYVDTMRQVRGMDGPADPDQK